MAIALCYVSSEVDIISIRLGVLSVILGTLAIGQAFFYKKEQERQAKVQDIFLREQRINMALSCIRNREIYRRVCTNGEIVLRKDRVVVYATSSFRYETYYKNVDAIRELLVEVLKDCYETGVIKAIQKNDIKQGNYIYEAFLRRECDADYLKQIIKVNDNLSKYGLYLSVIIEQ